MSKEHKNYLNNLRDSGVVNMFGAGEFLVATFGLNKRDANKLLLEWMESFEEEEV